eukprot:TRINITY_DN5881_c0_g1_i28.p2 TRINITY_DN5881_c0_g1~~TRINITY_DN5881_c0_g1_i28.p2  ORF type:complete len:112 (-),score=18.94 TRINITY_DN5881_c0_g1_i28:165-500(-)
MCRNFPNCKFGDKCFYIHPQIACKFGMHCTKMNCCYTHPPRFPMDYSMNYYNPMAFMNYKMPRPRNLKLGQRPEAANAAQKPEEKTPSAQAVVEGGSANEEKAPAVAEQPQ